jgi:hypothetical protein
MAMFVSMSFDPSEIISTYTPERLHAVSKIPVRTLYRWRQKKTVPGVGIAQQWRIDQLKAAAEKLKAAPRRKRRAA